MLRDYVRLRHAVALADIANADSATSNGAPRPT
jgi:hypothetical protein